MTSPQTARSDHDTAPTAGSHGGRALILRIRFLCGMSVSIVIFWYVGWWVAHPVDPDGPVSLLMLDQSVIAMAELLGLAVVSSGLAVVICGGDVIVGRAGPADRGPLAIAVGLAALGLRGSQLDAMVLYRLNAPTYQTVPLDPFPVWGLIAECWLWLALIAVGFVVGRWVESWSDPPAHGRLQTEASTAADPVSADHASDLRQGLGTIAVAALVAWTVLSFTVGTEAGPILKGQIYFSLGLAFLLGAMSAHWFLRSGSRVWALVAVALVATVAYVFGAPDDSTFEAAGAAGTYVNIRPFARPLPMEFAAMGAVGVLLESDAMNFFRAMFGLGAEEPRKS